LSRWTTRELDAVDVLQLREVPTETVLAQADTMAEERLRPRELFQRWESRGWNPGAIELDADLQAWHENLPARLKDNLEHLLSAFVVGEYTALDLLAPIMLGATDEEDLLYLGSQVADEAKHTRFLQRIGSELLGLGNATGEVVAEAWTRISPSHRQLCALEGSLVRELAIAPLDYVRWLRAVTMFHLVTEGVLALVGQRRLVRGLRRTGILPGVSDGFIAMTRDEARHVSYGLHAIRLGIRAGHEVEVAAVIEQAGPLVATIEVRPGDGVRQRRLARRTGAETIAALKARMAQAGLRRSFAERVTTTSREALWDATEPEGGER
jgi:hypothetical protein